MHKAIEDHINEEVIFKNSPIKLSVQIPTLEEIDKVSEELSKCKIPTVEEQCSPLKLPKVPNMATQTHEFDLFLRFWKDLKIGSPDFRPHRTEWSVYDENKRISGNIDLTLTNNAGDIIICDWKRSKEIKKGNLYQKGLKIFSHLDDCNYNHYCIQLNVYRQLLETNYEKKVVGMFLVILHPNYEKYLFIPVPKLQKEIDDLWALLPLTFDEHK